MKYEPAKHHRRSIRLKKYDYAQAGTYFVTICTQDRECLFGDVVDGEMRLNDAGCMIQKWWHESAEKFKNIELDEFVIMPNHFHGIIHIGKNQFNTECPQNSQTTNCTDTMHRVSDDQSPTEQKDTMHRVSTIQNQETIYLEFLNLITGVRTCFRLQTR